jgi:hypothetical protein
MADIRLKTITVENNNPLTIQKNYINVTFTNPSTDAITGTIVTSGGIGVNCTADSISSTSGGAITVAGGVAIKKNTFMGGNVTLDSPSSTFNVNGILSNRLFVDSTTNKRIYFAPDGSNNRLDLTDTRLTLNITQPSTNTSNGALVINGGISVNCSNNATNFSSGGALSIAGGTCVLGDVYLNKQLNVKETTTLYDSVNLFDSSANANVVTMDTDNIDFNITNSLGNINLNAQSGVVEVTTNEFFINSIATIINSTVSTNSSTGCLVLEGGLSIDNTADTQSVTSGGCLTIAGGMSIKKKTMTGDTISIDLNNANKSNKLMLYQINNSLSETNYFTGLGSLSQGSLLLNVSDTSKDFIFSSCTNGSSRTEILRVKGTNEVKFMGNQQSYSLIGGGSSNDAFSLQSQTSTKDFSFDLFTANGDQNDDIYLKLFPKGLPNNVSNSEYIQLGWDNVNDFYNLSINASGTGNYRDFIISNQHTNIEIDPNGITTFNSTVPSTNSFSASVVSLGGVSIHNTSLSTSLTEGGAFTVNGGASFKSSVYVGENIYLVDTTGSTMTIENNTNNITISSPNNTIHFTNSGTPGANISLYNIGNVNSANSESIAIYSTNNMYSIQTSKQGTGNIQPLALTVGTNTNQLFLATNGNVGIDTSNPNYKLDISGSINVSNTTTLNDVKITNITDAIGLGSGGSLTVQGGTSIQKDTFIGGHVKILNTDSSTSSSTGALIVSGGVSIKSTANAVFGHGGSLSVYGGTYIAKDLYLDGNLNVGGTINGSGSSSSTYAYITLTATDNAINYSTGSLITFGGITIQSDANANNLLDGGTFLTPGGASIAKDIYIGENLYNYGISNLTVTHYRSTESNIILFHDNFNVKRFSIDRDLASNNLSISRYNASGTFLQKSIDISNATGIIKLNNTTNSTDSNTGSLVIAGGLTIQTTTDATNLNNGGAFTTFGGMSVQKQLLVGGDVTMYSTSESTDISHGALMVQGGLSVYKNVNIGGNTIIQGNLTVNGTTSSIESTNVNISDNVLVLNSGPDGSKDAGLFIQRYQTDNDTALGDVVADTPSFTDILPNQSGITSTQIKLSSGASSINNAYTNMWIKISSGFSINQVRLITNYVGATRIATISSPWTTQNPAMNDHVSIYNKPYVGMIYNETNNRFEFVSSLTDQNITTVSVTDHLPVYFSNATAVSTQSSTSATEGAIVLTSGGLSINNTTDVTSITSGGSLTAAGGVAIGKSLYIGTGINVNGVNMTPNSNDILRTTSFTAANNVNIPANITGLSFTNDAWGFDVYLSAKLLSTSGHMYSNYHIRGVNKDSTWQIVSAYVGDSIVDFSITSSGQIQYTTPNYSGFQSLVFKFKAITN